MSHSDNADTTSKNIAQCDEQKHSVSHSQRINPSTKMSLFSEAFNDFMLVGLRCPVPENGTGFPRGHRQNKPQMRSYFELETNG